VHEGNEEADKEAERGSTMQRPGIEELRAGELRYVLHDK
jgi:hypothetical protein